MVDAALIGGLLSNLAPLIKDEFSLFWNYKKEVRKLLSTLSSISAVLEDAERKNLCEKDKQTEDWLRKLKDVAYEVRDIMDECTYEDLRLQVNRRNASSSMRIQVTNFIAHPFSNTWMHLKIGHKIRDIQEKLGLISPERSKLHLLQSSKDSKSVSWRQTISKLSEKVYGRDSEKEEIVDILVHSSNDANEVSVLPILGLGGLGKTTLAQLVFNNKEVTKHFDAKFWVCVSEEFNIKLIIKGIIGETEETSLEILQNRIKDKLKGKRYLLVLDDVWNENVEQWKLLRSILSCGTNGAFILTTTRKKIVAEVMKTVKPFELLPISEDDCWSLLEERAFMYGIPKTTNFIGIGKEIAIKCKGVPLVAKTLGGQLGFKKDEKEWCKIRDSEMWEISQNEESLLPILRLSYYDLPYPLRRCFAFCAIFPKDTEIEKERLIQLWMAHDLIPANKIQEVEEDGNAIWDELCWRSFFQDESVLDWIGDNKTCKMHDLIHDLALSAMKDECYTMDAKSSSKDFRQEIRHLIIMLDEFEELPFTSLKNKRALQSIIFHSRYKSVSHKTFSVLKELSALRSLEVFSEVKGLDLHYVGYLKHLRYLDLSGNNMIKSLPNSICDLLKLQTLKLDYCSYLESLPRNTKNLINLRHLHLKGCIELKYMPRGMGQLRNLKTLSLFVIGKESECQLDELTELDIRGYLEIKNLGSVSDASIARGISMSKKSSINELELYWNDKDCNTNKNQKKTKHEKVGEALEVSSSLRRLVMQGYKGMFIPKWMGESSASLVELRLGEMDNVQHIFTMNNMYTSASEHGMVDQLFPLLEELYLWDMKNLRELVSPPIPITGAFSNLWSLTINNCPSLGALPPHLNSLKYVSVKGECSDELLHSISNLNGLINLNLNNMSERSVFVGAAGTSSNDMVLFSLLEKLCLQGMKNMKEFVSPPFAITTTGAFPNLHMLVIIDCPNLRALPFHLKSLKHLRIHGECSDEFCHSISNLSGLTHLHFNGLQERSVLFPAANNKALVLADDELTLSTVVDNNEAQGPSSFQSLLHLSIRAIRTLRCLFDEECEKLEAGGGGGKRERTRDLTNLNYLEITSCPELMIPLEQWRHLTHSLQGLWIKGCPKLVSSKVEEADEVFALLYSLRARLGREKISVDFLKR